jgi:hypothetical protein
MKEFWTTLVTCLVISLPACSNGPGGISEDRPSAPEDQVVEPERWPDRVREGHLSVVSEFALTVEPGEALDIEAFNISTGGDPVIHLLDRDTGQQLASSNTEADGVSARLTYRGPTARFILVVRSRIQNAAGTTDLLRNGQIWQQGVEFGGWHLAYSELPRNERLQIVHLPNGATGTQALYVLADNTHDIDFRTRGGSVGGAPDFIIPSDLV